MTSQIARDGGASPPGPGATSGATGPTTSQVTAGGATAGGTPGDTHQAPAGDSSIGDATTGELVKKLSTQLSELVRGELELARAELTTKGKRAGAGAGLAGAGGVVALFGVGALVAAAIAALALVVPVWLAAVAVGVLLLLIGGLLAAIGRNRLREAVPPVPEQAVEGVQRDVETVKQAVHR